MSEWVPGNRYYWVDWMSAVWGYQCLDDINGIGGA